ncbi:flagellar basal body P-ring protein FlgI [Gallaecimonas mangrovi]|uniref:flagellar basal body P-ring protein FlgI n=1 Tax=Gallaecimonas mangrovi TaxID=2291597 RepID=UPI000E2036CD|nr:flagellar basal body P-ring protein FlgI [Gallaecimonas mangrovi]
MKRFWFLALLLSFTVHAERIKDVADVAGVRNNQLTGYGLVVGLPGTGEQSTFTQQSFQSMLRNFGIQVPAGGRLNIKNVAAVAVSATLPPFAKPGQQIDITVSSVGSAKSLRGGTLLQTFLKGVDGQVYALAQGNLMVSGFSADGLDGSKIVGNTPTAGRIPDGAIVEKAVKSPFDNGDFITFNLRQSDFTTAKRMEDTINNLLGPGVARALDATSVQVRAPRSADQRVSFLSTLENLEFQPANGAAKIIVNSRTGTIVVGADVRLKPAAITHGGLTITIAENTQVSQPNALGQGQTAVTPNSNIQVNEKQARMFYFNPGVTLQDLVRAVNQVGAAPSDVMAILEALKQAGALSGELIVI